MGGLELLHLCRLWGSRSLSVDAWPHRNLPRRQDTPPPAPAHAAVRSFSRPDETIQISHSGPEHTAWGVHQLDLGAEEKVPHNVTLEVLPSNALYIDPLQPSSSLECLNRGSKNVSP